MQPAIARIHQGLSALILAGLILDVYLVGAGLFGATTFEPHRLLGLILAISIAAAWTPRVAIRGSSGSPLPQRVIGASGSPRGPPRQPECSQRPL